MYNKDRYKKWIASPENKKKKAENDRIFRERHKSEVNARIADWKKRNPQNVRVWSKRQSLKRKLTGFNSSDGELVRKSNYLKTVRVEVLKYYGNGKLSCVCCGEGELRFLTIDHMNNNGAEERRRIHRSGSSLAAYLKKRKFPKGYQTMCCNCNFGRAYAKDNICPHKSKEASMLTNAPFDPDITMDA